VAASGGRGGGEREPARQLDRAGVEDSGERRRVAHRFGGDVEGTARVAVDREPVRLADVQRVNGLESKPRDVGHDRDVARHEPREQPAREQPPLLLAGLALEDQTRPQPDDADAVMLAFETVEPPLDLGFVPRVEAGGDAVRRPGLVDEAVLRPR